MTESTSGVAPCDEAQQLDTLRQTLEIIAVGDSRDPKADADAALRATGFWKRRPLTGTQSVIAAIKAKLESEPPAGGDAYHPLYTMSQIEQAAQIARGVTALRPCRSPYCECDQGKCTHPGFYDARGVQASQATDADLDALAKKHTKVHHQTTHGWGTVPVAKLDHIAFARAVFAAHGVDLPDGGQQ